MAAFKSASNNSSSIPDGFVSPFARVEMAPNARYDDGLCCIAMLTGNPLNAVLQLAFQFGFPEHGPGWVYSSMLIKILQHFEMTATEKEVKTIDLLPPVALITASYSPATQYGRWVLWHRVPGSDSSPAFHYVVDPAYWVPADQKTTTDLKSLLTPKQPIYYIEVAPKAMAKPKAK